MAWPPAARRAALILLLLLAGCGAGAESDRLGANEPGEPARVLHTLEDTPFYVRSMLDSSLLGERVSSVHETLNVPRLMARTTRLMLPWRMPRVK